MQPHQVHEAIHHIRPAREIAHILQHAEQRKEDHQDRQEGQHRARAVDDPVVDQRQQPRGAARQRRGRQAAKPAEHGHGQPLRDRRRDGIGQPEGHAEDRQQQAQPQQRVRRNSIQPLGDGDRAGARLGDRGAHHAPDPLVAPAGDVQVGVLVVEQDVVHLRPDGLGQRGLHDGGHLAVPLQQLQRDPLRLVRRGDVPIQQQRERVQHRPMFGTDLGAVRRKTAGIDGQLQRGVHQLADADVARGHHLDHRHAERGLQHVRLDADAVLLGHVAHVEPDDEGPAQRQQLRGEIEAPFQRGRVDHCHDHVGLLLQEILARDALLLGVGGQAVGARQIDDVERRVAVLKAAGLLLDGLARPVAHVLVQAGQHVEDGGLADVGLADQRDGQLRGRAHGRASVAVVVAAGLDQLQDGLHGRRGQLSFEWRPHLQAPISSARPAARRYGRPPGVPAQPACRATPPAQARARSSDG
ncbi:MAG: hypothetical protein BWY52_02694 [Chloroflexi bacterium ADurb.Bin325]|nr:MAG: hypothetical protein BWY52_02694 [Chloroflexi bacterium ADurb.Bin325]